LKNKLLISLVILFTIILGACTAKNSTSSTQLQTNNADNTKEQQINNETSSTEGQTDNKINSEESQTSATIVPDTQQKNIRIVVEPPTGWEPVTGSVLPVQYLKNTASFMVKEEPFQGKTLDEVVTEAKAAFDYAFDNVAYIGEAESITIDEKDAKKIIFTCKISNMQMKYEYVYLFAGSGVYAITFGDLEDNFDSQAADYEEILGNIHFE
jgi:predicted RNase H-like HicB family nuclease